MTNSSRSGRLQRAGPAIQRYASPCKQAESMRDRDSAASFEQIRQALPNPSWAHAALNAVEADYEQAMEHLREFNHVEGEPLSEVAAVAESAYGFAKHRAEAAEAENARLREEVSRVRGSLHDAVRVTDIDKLAETVRAGMMLVGSDSSVAPAISREEAMLAHAALDSLAALAGGDSE